MTAHEERKYPPVEPTGVCRYFNRTDTSLIEEPEICEFCTWCIDGCCHRDQSPS